MGLSIAKKFLKEGLNVAFIDNNERLLNTVKNLYQDDTKTLFLLTDVSDKQSVKEGVSTILHQWGRIDVLVNNAAIRKETPLEEITEEEWNLIISVNLGGTFFISQAVVNTMKQQQRGRIINVSSFGGQFGPLTSGAHYSASKAGQITLTKVFARSLADQGITVNAITPAAIETPEMDNMDPEKLNKMKESIPVKRFGDSEDVSDMVLYLSSPSASYITGATFDINGGLLMR
ncbi:SDR family NAD(P)-dependent oxidoreductase [Salicibibacter cibarius]|uniref:SDR family NAD(P)-dependent oxidoreductase n=1 Tax=Salicibibacter cibarius TaxID=2743000 RepID=UPI001FE32A32|nr:SDR family NAD(P)-dependent oxidoreductase [Salicibibacter cibarius]